MNHHRITTIDISTNTIIRILGVVAFIFLLLETWRILASVFLAIVIAAALEPSLRWLESHRIRRAVSVPAIYLVAFAGLAGVFYVILPGLFSEINTLSRDLPDKITSFLNTQTGEDESGGLAFIVPYVEDLLQSIQSKIGDLGGDVFVFITSIFGGVVSFFFTLVASFYLSLDRKEVERFLTEITPVSYRSHVSDLWSRIQKRLGHWLQAQFILAIFMGVSVFILLTILGSPYATTLGILAGFLEIIPFLGPLIAGVLILLFVSLGAGDPNIITGLIAVAVYVLFQQIEQNFILPTVMARVVGSNPLVILTSALIGAELLGFWGIIIAIPLVAVLGEVMRDFQSDESQTKVPQNSKPPP